jgi:hypothetical protein
LVSGFKVSELYISELDQQKLRSYQSRTTVYLHHEEGLVRNFELTCYYVAPNFARTFARTIQCGTGGRSGISGQCGISKVRFLEVLTILPLGA